MKFAVLTFSEVFANHVGGLIEMNKVNREDVEVTILWENERMEESTYKFNEDGVMEEAWPIGFYLP